MKSKVPTQLADCSIRRSIDGSKQGIALPLRTRGSSHARMALALLHGVYRAIHLSILKVCSVFCAGAKKAKPPAAARTSSRPARPGLGMDPALEGGREPGDPSLPSSLLEFLLVCCAADSTITHVMFRISRLKLHSRKLNSSLGSLLAPHVRSDCVELAFFLLDAGLKQ